MDEIRAIASTITGELEAPVLVVPDGRTLYSMKCFWCGITYYSPSKRHVDHHISQHMRLCPKNLPVIEARERVAALEIELNAVRAESIAKDKKQKR